MNRKVVNVRESHRRVIIVLGAIVGALTLVAAPVGAVHDPDITDREMKCQLGMTAAVAKLFIKKVRCLVDCQRDAREGGDPADCVPPYGGDTFGCVQAAEGKATGVGKKKCGSDCPECYSGGDCIAETDSRVAAAEALVDALSPDLFCDDTGSGDGLTEGEARCQDTVAKGILKFGAKAIKCVGKCRKFAHAGRIPPDSCEPGSISDPTGRTQLCLDKAETKTVLRIDRRCDPAVDPRADAPECYDGSASRPNTGAGWLTVMNAIIDDMGGSDPGDLYCGSPSGAFLAETTGLLD